MIIAKHPGIKKVLAKMASEAGFPGTGKMSRVSLIVDGDDIFLLGHMNGRTILAQGNFFTIGIQVTQNDDDEFIATRYLGNGEAEHYDLSYVSDYADALRSECIVAHSDEFAGRLFRSKRRVEPRVTCEPLTEEIRAVDPDGDSGSGQSTL